MRLAKDFDEKAGVIQRQHELEDLENRISGTEKQIQQAMENLNSEESCLETLEQDRDGLLKELTKLIVSFQKPVQINRHS